MNETETEILNQTSSLVEKASQIRVNADNLLGLPKGLVREINEFFFRLLGTNKFTIIIIVLAFALIFKRRYREGWLMTILFSLMLYGFLVWAGFGTS